MIWGPVGKSIPTPEALQGVVRIGNFAYPYYRLFLIGFSALVAQGADFRRVDKVMERFGWPMGPAYLLDVVGMDTALHAGEVMAEGFPDRMGDMSGGVIPRMVEHERLGQKNGKGFYAYQEDRKGKPQKLEDDEALALVRQVAEGEQDFSDEAIIARMMAADCGLRPRFMTKARSILILSNGNACR